MRGPAIPQEAKYLACLLERRRDEGRRRIEWAGGTARAGDAARPASSKKAPRRGLIAFSRRSIGQSIPVTSTLRLYFIPAFAAFDARRTNRIFIETSALPIGMLGLDWNGSVAVDARKATLLEVLSFMQIIATA